MEEFDAIEDIDDFAKFAAQQEEVWSDGLVHGEPSYQLNDHDADNTGIPIICTRSGWLAIIARYKATKDSQ